MTGLCVAMNWRVRCAAGIRETRGP
jgi:hypothetical protein